MRTARPTGPPLLAALLALAILAPALPALAEEALPAPYTKRVAVLLYDGVELLDFAGPAEVFQAAAGFGAAADEPAFEVYTVGRSREAITSQRFLEVVPDFAAADAPMPHVLVLPGGSSGTVTRDPALMEWVGRAARGAEVTLTVCTGAFVLGRAGLLDGRDVTTWYGAVDRLAAAAPKARVHHGRRFVDSGEVVTTAGVSAGIDGSLHLVARLLGRRVADATARYMEYHWTPEPYLARAYPDENPRLDGRGRAVAAADALRSAGDWPAAAAAYRALLDADPADGRASYYLGYSLHAAGRHREAAQAHERAAGYPSHRAMALYNLACARALLGQREAALAALEQAVAAGFDDLALITGDDELDTVRDDPRFRAAVARIPRP